MANKYGDSGNRWWVGQNVGGSAAEKNPLGDAIVPIASPLIPGTPPAGYESLPSGNAADDKKFAAAALADKAGAHTTITVEGIKWYNINGPYTTQAAANAAIAGIQSKTPAQGEAGQVVNNVANLLGKITGGIIDFSGTNFFLRALKVVVGGVLVIVGFMRMTGAENAITKVASKVPIIPV